MPLEQGSNEASIHENIKRLMGEGKSRSQAVAIAESIAKKAKEKGDDDLECSALGYEKEHYLDPHNQTGAANPLGFVYGGIQNQGTGTQYPYGGQ